VFRMAKEESGAEGSRTLDLLNAILVPRCDSQPRTPTSGQIPEDFLCAVPHAIAGCGHAFAERTRRVGRDRGPVREMPRAKVVYFDTFGNVIVFTEMNVRTLHARPARA
jgi:hypothetical protein